MSAEVMDALRSLGAPATAIDVARALGYRYADRAECGMVARELREMACKGEVLASVDPRKGKLYAPPVEPTRSKGRGRPPTVLLAVLGALRDNGPLERSELPGKSNLGRIESNGLISKVQRGVYEITPKGLAYLEEAGA